MVLVIPMYTRTTNRDSKGQLSICTVDEQLTLGLLKRLETHKATRMNGISSRLLKLTAPGIAVRLTHLFNCSLKTGEIPSEWKSANITPVFKKGKKADVNNYMQTCISASNYCQSVLEKCSQATACTNT